VIALRHVAYGLWCWLLFVAVALGAVLVALPVPQVTLRRRIAAGAARTFFRGAGVRLSVAGLERLPPGASVVVANHTSYVDGVVLQAALPPRFAFVIKKEMGRVPVAGFLLRRLGSEFVERFDRQKGSADARRVLRAAAGGQALAFFPEGTFSEQVGLGRFHAGAFVAAHRNKLPLVPAAIRGARRFLPPAAFLPRRHPIEVEILAPLPVPPAEARDGALSLRQAARAAILARIDEPDLEA
jgi:1-acyl-sn-glycerol-3-phosphate acyltransferase